MPTISGTSSRFGQKTNSKDWVEDFSSSLYIFESDDNQYSNFVVYFLTAIPEL